MAQQASIVVGFFTIPTLLFELLDLYVVKVLPGETGNFMAKNKCAALVRLQPHSAKIGKEDVQLYMIIVL